MSGRVRDEDGQFVETLTPERVLAVMRDADVPVLTAGDIAEELGCTPEAVTKKLNRLQKQDRVARRQVGARAVVWWLTEQPPLDTEGEHDPEDPLFAAPPLDAEGVSRSTSPTPMKSSVTPSPRTYGAGITLAGSSAARTRL